MMKFEKVRAALEARKDRSAWDKGVTLYAFDLLDSLEEAARGGWVAVDDLNDGQILKKPRGVARCSGPRTSSGLRKGSRGLG